MATVPSNDDAALAVRTAEVLTRNAFREDMKKLFESEEGDITIEGYDGKRWIVHSNIISAQCAFFKIACNGQFKEAQTRTISMLDDDPEALHCLLEFLYTGRYAYNAHNDDGPLQTDLETDAEWIELVLRHAEVFSLADKYDIKGLKRLARGRLCVASVASVRCLAVGEYVAGINLVLDEDY